MGKNVNQLVARTVIAVCAVVALLIVAGLVVIATIVPSESFYEVLEVVCGLLASLMILVSVALFARSIHKLTAAMRQQSLAIIEAEDRRSYLLVASDALRMQKKATVAFYLLEAQVRSAIDAAGKSDLTLPPAVFRSIAEEAAKAIAEMHPYLELLAARNPTATFHCRNHLSTLIGAASVAQIHARELAKLSLEPTVNSAALHELEIEQLTRCQRAISDARDDLNEAVATLLAT